MLRRVGKVTLKAQLASEVAHIRQLRPDVRIVAIADAAADNWTFLETLSPETEVRIDWLACLRTSPNCRHPTMRWPPTGSRGTAEVLRHDPCGVDKVIRALRHLRDSAKPDRAEIERELAFFRKHRQRMRYHALKAEGVAIGSGVVEAANKTLVTQRMKRSGMRWRIAGRTGCADLPRPDQIRLASTGHGRPSSAQPTHRPTTTSIPVPSSPSLPELNERSPCYQCHTRLACPSGADLFPASGL